MMSSKAKYALRAAVHLAGREGWTLAADIAETEAIPKKFLEAILVALRDHGVIESRRGRHGGHRLAKEATAIVAADVIRVIDGPLALTPCASLTQYGICPDCVAPALCALQPMLRRARDAVAGVLDACTLADLARERAVRRQE